MKDEMTEGQTTTPINGQMMVDMVLDWAFRCGQESLEHTMTVARDAWQDGKDTGLAANLSEDWEEIVPLTAKVWKEVVERVGEDGLEVIEAAINLRKEELHRIMREKEQKFSSRN